MDEEELDYLRSFLSDVEVISDSEISTEEVELPETEDLDYIRSFLSEPESS